MPRLVKAATIASIVGLMLLVAPVFAQEQGQSQTNPNKDKPTQQLKHAAQSVPAAVDEQDA